MNLIFTLPALSLALPDGMNPAEYGAAQADIVNAFISRLSEHGHTLSAPSTLTNVSGASSTPRSAGNGGERFETAYKMLKGFSRMHFKGDKETETRESYAKRLLIEMGEESLVTALDEMGDGDTVESVMEMLKANPPPTPTLPVGRDASEIDESVLS